jgi:hypothetical protein
MTKRAFAVALLAMFAAQAARAEPTEIAIRVLSKGAKFIGTSMGGARIMVRDAETGALLASGTTEGSTGDTERIMNRARRGDLSDPSVAVFRTTLDVTRPMLIEAEARGPVAQPQSSVRALATRWILPGMHLTAGDGWVLELAGLSVDVLAPPAHLRLASGVRTVEVRANVALICGCAIEPGGTWDARGYHVEAELHRDGKPVGRFPLRYAGSTSQFVGEVPVAGAGSYEVVVTAFGAADGNAGVDRTTFMVR